MDSYGFCAHVVVVKQQRERHRDGASLPHTRRGGGRTYRDVVVVDRIEDGACVGAGPEGHHGDDTDQERLDPGFARDRGSHGSGAQPSSQAGAIDGAEPTSAIGR